MTNLSGDVVRAASYGRQSKLREDESAGSPIAQQIATSAFIQAREWRFVRHFEDLGASGYDPKADRPALDELLAMVRRREIDVVVVYRLDRFTRQGVIEAVRLIGEMAKYGVALASVCEPFLDTTTPMGRGIFALFAAMAEQESYNIQMRTRATKAVIRAAGGFAGGQRPYGQTPVKIIEGKLALLHLKRHPVEAPILAEVIRRILQDDASVAGEARRLNAEGVRTSAGKEWGTSTLIRLLRHPVIAGYSASLRGEIVRDEATGEPLRPWEGVVELDVWHELQAKLANRGPGRGPLRPEATLLGGLDIFVCAHCGGRMAGDRRKDGGGTYRCSRHRRGSALCGGAGISMSHLDRHIVSEVFSRFASLDENDPEDLDLLRAVALRYSAADEDPELAAARASAQAMIEDAMSALDRLDDDRYNSHAFDGELGATRYRRQSAVLTERVAACQARLKALPQPAPADNISIILRMRDEFRHDDAGVPPEDPRGFFYSAWTAQERRDFIATFLDGILIRKGAGRQGGSVLWRGDERVRLVWASCSREAPHSFESRRPA